MTALSQSLLWQLACYLTFVFGQFLFLLKRAWSAKRNQTTAITSVGDYFRESSVPIIVRVFLEGGLYYLLLHYHVLLAWMVKFWGWSLPEGFNLQEYVNPVMTFFAGYVVDSAVDAVSVSSKIPQWLRDWIKENVPQNNFVGGVQEAKPQPAVVIKP